MPTHRSLTDAGGDYSLWGAGLRHTTFRPSWPMVSTFHLRVPPDLQFNQVLSMKQSVEFKEPMTTTWSSNQSVIYRSLHLLLSIANLCWLWHFLGSLLRVVYHKYVSMRHQHNCNAWGAKSGKMHNHAQPTHFNPYKLFTNLPLTFLVF
jgi:hypothetical protein